MARKKVAKVDYLNGMDNLGPIDPTLTGSKWAFAKLKEMNVDNVQVQYSGGNDSGGVDEIVFIHNDTSESIKYEVSVHRTFQDGKWVFERELTEDEKLNYILCKPVYDKYYGFDGDNYYDGKIIWDTKNESIEDRGCVDERVSNDYTENIMDFEMD